MSFTDHEMTEAFQTAMDELEETLDLIERHGPKMIRSCLQANSIPGRRSGRRPAELPEIAAKLIREIADDAAVRVISEAA